MSLFGAATSGVDPQTGSYLSKEQRVAMFRASQGRGGTGSGATSNKKANVQANSAIVVANKMTSVVQTLQSFSQQNVENVSQQVQENKKNLENLYSNVAAARDAEAKEEKLITAQKREDRESWLRGAKENLVEGISGAVAGVANTAQAAGRAALSPMMSLWDKIRAALLALGGAWAIDNLPSILSAIENFSLDDFRDTAVEKITSMRGVWSILDDVLAGVRRSIGRIARASWRLSSFLVRKTVSISRRVITAISDFVLGVTRRIVNKLAQILGDAASSLRNAARAPVQSATEFLDQSTKPLRNWLSETPIGRAFTSVKDFATEKGSSLMRRGGELIDGAKTTVSGGLAKLQETTTGVKPQSNAKRVGWLKKALEPIGRAYPQLRGALRGIGNIAKRVMSIVPGLGFAIDLALNKKVAGQDWTEAIIRALGSSIVGGLSAAAGAKAGGLAGAAIGAPLAGIGAIPGAAIGAALGAILAGIAGGAGGDMIGAEIFEFTTGEKRTENRPMGSGVIDSITGNTNNTNSTDLGTHIEKEPTSFDYKINGTSMTGATANGGDLGLYNPETFDMESSVQVIDMPPTMTKMSVDGDKPTESKEVTQIKEFFSADPDMNIYREMAADIYQVGG